VILVDTPVWVDHLRAGDGRLFALLQAGQMLAHPFVIGEIALGHLKQRQAVLANLPQAMAARDNEVLLFIDRNDLAGTGLGYVDAHLLASAQLLAGTAILTRDRRLQGAAMRLGLAA
jgi:hypothetical protein